jgi:hypothetical protein
MDMQIFNLEQVRRDAELAADQDRGPQANPHADVSPLFQEWLNAYYQRIQANAISLVA